MTNLGAADVRVRFFDRAGTLLGTFCGLDLSASDSSTPADAQMQCTLHSTEPGFSETIADDALAQVQGFRSGAWSILGQPFLVKGDVSPIASAGGAFSTVRVSGGSALMGLTAQLQVTPDQGLWYRRAMGNDRPGVVFFGWQAPSFDDSAWYGVNRHAVTDVEVTGGPKHNQPTGWAFPECDWIYIDPAVHTGGLTLFRLGTFAADGTTKYEISSNADEEHKLYLFGPGQGAVVIEQSDQETGYTRRTPFREVLPAGDYFLAAEQTSVSTTGGDGFDALRFYVATVGDNGKADTLVLGSTSDNDIQAWRQGKDAQRPGLTVGKIIHLILTWNRAWTPDDAATANIIGTTFDADTDTDSVSWPDAHERSWEAGTPLSQVIEDLSDVADFSMSPGRLIDAWVDRGASKSGISGLVAGSSARAATENVLLVDTETTAKVVNTASLLTEDGYATSVDDDKVAADGSRTLFLSSIQASSVGEGKRLAARYIDEQGRHRTQYTIPHLGSEGGTPGLDFDWGDTALPTVSRTGGVRGARVLRWTISRNGERVQFETAVE